MRPTLFRFLRPETPVVLAALALPTATPVVHAQGPRPVAVVGGTLLDGGGGPPLPDATVIMRGDTIVAVGPARSIAVPRDAIRVDATGLTVLPGLIDGHVHAGLEAFMGTPAPFDSVLRAALEAGVTSLVDLGNNAPWILAVRDSLAAGLRAGPRLLAAGAVITAPGGHPAGTLLRGNAVAARLGTRTPETAQEAGASVRELAAAGVDLIKLIYDGGSTRSPFGIIPRLDPAVMRAAAATAREVRLPVFVHWASGADLFEVLAAKPDVLVHLSIGSLPDSALVAIANARVIVQPTAVAVATYLPANLLDRLYLSNVRRLARAGVRVAAGSDAPLGAPVGTGLLRELELLVTAGLSPAEALDAATRTAADAIRRDDLGRIRPGGRADLIAVRGDPTTDLAALRGVAIVVARGKVVRSP
jgi:enamidase